jgi:hypothetical protein
VVTENQSSEIWRRGRVVCSSLPLFSLTIDINTGLIAKKFACHIRSGQAMHFFAYMFRFIKEVYLTMFIFFFRISTWPLRTKTAITAGMIAVIESWVLFGMALWIAIFAGAKVSPPMTRCIGVVAMTGLYIANLIVARHYVPEFDHKFVDFKNSKKALLLTGSVVLMIAAIAFCLYSGSTYREFASHP